MSRSRYKKYFRKRAARRGKRSHKGSPFDAEKPSQCLRCDRGQHRACEDLSSCTSLYKRSPPGVNKRENGEPRARAPRRSPARAPRARRALRAAPLRRLALVLSAALMSLSAASLVCDAERAAKRAAKAEAKKAKEAMEAGL